MLAGCGVVFLTQRSGLARVFVSRCAANFPRMPWDRSRVLSGDFVSLARNDPSPCCEVCHGPVRSFAAQRRLSLRPKPDTRPCPSSLGDSALSVRKSGAASAATKQGHQEQAKVLVNLRVRFPHFPHSAFCSLWLVV
jgi:hypothetical protein